MTVWLSVGQHPAKELLHESFANLRDEPEAIGAFTKRWGQLFHFATAEFARGADRILTLRKRDSLRVMWRENVLSDRAIEFLHVQLRNVITRFEVTRERIEIKPRDLWQTAFLLFITDHLQGKTGICENPECPNSYFIKKRASQKYCESGGCVAYAQRKYAREWWHREGKQQRELRRKKAQAKKVKTQAKKRGQ
jgi:hypothetical protein